jgi:hypothetical protein
MIAGFDVLIGLMQDKQKAGLKGSPEFCIMVLTSACF